MNVSPAAQYETSPCVTMVLLPTIDCRLTLKQGWCDNLKEAPKGEWTTQEVTDYAEYCVVDRVTR